MSQVLYSVDQVAERLGLHVRTVRNYVRDGRLKAVRIGKQYRIAQSDLDALIGRPAAPPARDEAPEPARGARHVEVSSIVQIDAIGPEAAGRLTNALLGGLGGRRDDGRQLRVETVYDKERARMKIVVLGGLDTSASLFKLISALLEAQP